MKKNYIFTVCLMTVFSTLINAQTNIPAGNVSGIWTKANSPYRIQGDITVPRTQTLTIQPGVTVEFQGYYMIDIKGKIQALGAPGDTVLFTRKDTLGFHNMEIGNGGWNGIKFINSDEEPMNTSDTSLFTYCKFEYSKSIIPGNMWDNTGGGVIFMWNFSKIAFLNCVFRMNQSRAGGGAILVTSGGSPSIINCSFIRNKAFSGGGAILLQYASKPVIRGCLFYKNQSLIDGGAIWSHVGKGIIMNNIFSNNSSNQFGGAIHLISSNEFILGNLIVNNYARVNGGGLKMDDAWPVFFNNNVCNNHAGGGGGGIEVWGLCNADFYNNIIWGNTVSDAIKSPNQIWINPETSNVSTPNFYNCIIQDGIGGIENYNGKYANIIEDDPQFKDPSSQSGNDSEGLEADWTMIRTSPSINAGINTDLMNDLFITDLAGNPRIEHGNIDIGAYETRIETIIASGIIAESTSWIADTVKADGDIIINDNVTLNIAPGTCVEFQDYYGIQVLGRLVALGSEDSPITFTVRDTSGFHNPGSTNGSWNGIIFDNSQWGANGSMNDNDSSILRNCVVQYAKYFPSEWNSLVGGAIRIRYFSKLEISKCTFKNNISYQGGALSIDMYSNPLISGNLFYRNLATERGGGIYVCNNSKPLIIYNYILNNKAEDNNGAVDRGGGGLSIQSAQPVILDNVICNNYAEFGGGLSVGSSNPVFANNTICNNKCIDAGSALCEWESRFNIFNSIFWGNLSENDFYSTRPVAISGKINFYFNNIEGAESGINLPPAVPLGDYMENINKEPAFTNPTKGPGTDYDALAADFSITDLSPNINKGFPDFGQLMLTVKDIAGNKRVNHEIIDIGAFENQGNPVEIIRQPFGQVRCLGDNVEFSVLVDIESIATFQWLKNGDTIPVTDNNSAVTNTLVLDSITRDDIGDYICLVANGYGMFLSQGVRLEVNSPPEILFQTESQWVREDANIRLEVAARGTEPIFYKWKFEGTDIEGADIPELRILDMSLDKEGTYICEIKNNCDIIESKPVTLIQAPQICMVTVDLETGKNLVIWEKKGLAKVTEYNIYRESTVAGQYERIGNLPYNALSVFVDTVADPAKQAWIYKITATDMEGVESDIELCKPHKTIHLITSTNETTGDVQLSWDAYYGFEYGTYYLYRSPTLSNFTNIYSISSSLAAYTEANPENILYYYRVAVQRPIGADCYPTVNTSKKADSGPYSHSMSNIEDNRFQTGIKNIKSAGDLTIYPNPFNETAILKFPNPENGSFRLRIMDLTGKVILEINDISGSEYLLERNDLQKGYYIIEMSGDKIYRGRIVVE
jgi:hypothetical protein